MGRAPRLLSFSAVPCPGGAFSAVVLRLEELRRKGWEVTLASKDREGLAAGHARLRAAGVEIHFLDKDPARPLVTNPRVRWFGLLRAAPWDLVEVHRHTPIAAWVELLLAHLVGRRVVAVDHVTPRPVDVDLRVRAATWGCARVFLNSAEAAQAAVAHGMVGEAHVEVLPAPFEPRAPTGADARARVRAELGIEADAAVLLVVANHVEIVKSLCTVLDALPALRRVRTGVVALLAGEGPDTASYRARVEELGVAEAVRFLGWRADVGDLLAAADLLVHPSTSEAGVGLAVLEALHAEVPVVLSDIPAHAAARDAGAARVFPPGDPAALADAILEELAGAPARPGREFAGSFLAAEVAARVDARYRELLDA